MEILDIPEKLQQAILNPDKRLTVDLRVRAVWEFLTAAAGTQDKGAVNSSVYNAKRALKAEAASSEASTAPHEACSCQTAHAAQWVF